MCNIYSVHVLHVQLSLAFCTFVLLGLTDLQGSPKTENKHIP